MIRVIPSNPGQRELEFERGISFEVTNDQELLIFAGAECIGAVAKGEWYAVNVEKTVA